MSSPLKTVKTVALTAAMLGATVVPAYASGGSGGAVATPRPDSKDNFVPTRSLRGELVKISENSVTVRDAKGKETTVALDGKTKFKTEDKALFSGKTSLAGNDFNAGLNVRVLYREGDKTAVEVKALKPRKP